MTANTGLESYSKLMELGVNTRLLDSLPAASLEQLLASVKTLLESRGGPGSQILSNSIKAGLVTLPLLIWLFNQRSDMLPVLTNRILI